jgi:hypothetical protein
MGGMDKSGGGLREVARASESGILDFLRRPQGLSPHKRQESTSAEPDGYIPIVGRCRRCVRDKSGYDRGAG